MKFSGKTQGIFSVVVVASLSLIGCNDNLFSVFHSNKASDSIIGGSAVSEDDAISQSTVAIQGIVRTEGDPKAKGYTCTGTLISRSAILTAGHCVPVLNDNQKLQMQVFFNSDLDQLAQADVRYVDRFMVHPDFKKSRTGKDNADIAVLHITNEAPESYNVVSLMPPTAILRKGQSVTLAGYGFIDGAGKIKDNHLNKVDVKVLGYFSDTEVALDQSQGKGACHGDSGGPAFVTSGKDIYQWGITSRGVGKNGADDCSAFSIYTDVARFADFIEFAIEKYSGQ